MPASTTMPPSKPAAEWTLWYAKQNRIFIKESNAKQEHYSCSTSNLNRWWKSMQSFRALNAFSSISSQPESRRMPWHHFVEWLYVLSGSMISTSLLMLKILLPEVHTLCSKTPVHFRGSSVSLDSISSTQLRTCRSLSPSGPVQQHGCKVQSFARENLTSKIIEAWKLSSSCHATVRQSTYSPCTAWDGDLRGWQLASAMVAASLHLQWLKLWEQKPLQPITCFRSPALHDQAWGTIVVHL